MSYISTQGLSGEKLAFVQYLDAIVDRVLEHCEKSEEPMLWGELVGESDETGEPAPVPPPRASGRPKKGVTRAAQSSPPAQAVPEPPEPVLCPCCGTPDTETHRKTKIHATRSRKAASVAV